MQNCFLNLLLNISAKMRRKRLAKLLEFYPLENTTRILDVGGSGDWNWEELGVKPDITVINLYDPEEMEIPNYIQGDARDMHMFKDREFDLVVSNSVIEHLLCREDQRRMANEIQRVGRAYWVQTPNLHFPLELHLCFPFIQYWPARWRIAFSRIWPFSFEKMRGRTEGAVADAQAILLSKKKFQDLFPEADLVCEKFAGLTKSLIAAGRSDA